MRLLQFLNVKKLLVAIGLMFAISGFSQVKGVMYHLMPSATSQGYYDCYLIVNEGGAITTKDRLQFNSQVSIVVPTGTEVEVVNYYNPIQDNQEHKGTKPLVWEIAKPLRAPEVAATNDFYAFRPVLFPSAFYNDINQGDKIKLFTFKTNAKSETDVRLFQNGIDPGPEVPSMKGRDFNNGFCMGGVAQLYQGNMQ